MCPCAGAGVPIPAVGSAEVLSVLLQVLEWLCQQLAVLECLVCPCAGPGVSLPAVGSAGVLSVLLCRSWSVYASSWQCWSVKCALVQVLECLCQRLAVVERVGDTASLYASGLQGHHICLLVKIKVTTAVPTSGRTLVLVQYLMLIKFISHYSIIMYSYGNI